MAKEALKKAIAKKQGGVDALTLKTLPDVPWKVDTDRIEQKAAGGTYTDENTRILLPITHMKRHGNYRQRPEDLEHLKALVDHRTQILRIRLKVENQLRAYKRRTDYLLPHTLEILEGMLEPIKQHALEAPRRPYHPKQSVPLLLRTA